MDGKKHEIASKSTTKQYPGSGRSSVSREGKSVSTNKHAMHPSPMNLFVADK